MLEYKISYKYEIDLHLIKWNRCVATDAVKYQTSVFFSGLQN